MADKEQLSMLKKKGGVSAWNKWRFEYPEIIPDLCGADLGGADLHGANLSTADLSDADLTGAALSGADLYFANLSRANLSWADLSWANLSGADLSWASLSDADLHGADLSGADLSGADLSGADLSGADLSNSSMGFAPLGNVDLSGVKGLETIRHGGPSSIGIDTIYRSNGEIPEVFLRGAGVPDSFIEQMKFLVGTATAIEFYSCFISYSSKDDEFTQRLYADLQREHVRCWFAPEDLKIGDKFRRKIDEAIRIYDKLLLILSETSIHSPWVETEVEAAFEKERKSPGKTVLFPIRLDEAVMKTEQAWAADIRRTRHIGDFSNWKNHDDYKKAFDRLLRDLNAKDKDPKTTE
jgi:hypothetical protein